MLFRVVSLFKSKKVYILHITGYNSAGFRWWGAQGPGVVGGPMCGYIESYCSGWPMKSYFHGSLIFMT